MVFMICIIMSKQKYESNSNYQSSLMKNYSSSMYSLLSQKTSEIEKIPLNPNFLTFKDPNIEKKYFQTLFCSHESIKKPSDEFRLNLFVFYSFFSFYIIATVIQDLVLYVNNQLFTSYYVLKTVLLGITITASYTILNVMLKSHFALKNSIKIFNGLGILIISSVVLTHPQIMSSIVNSPEPLQYTSPSMILLALIILLKRLLFENFGSVLLLSMYSVFSLLLSLMICNFENMVKGLYEVFLLFIFMVLMCITTYKHSLAARELFWKSEVKSKHLDELSEITEYNDPMNANCINTEIELLVLLCAKIKKIIKGAHALLIFKDVKTKLKVALNELDNLKKRITGDIFRQAVILENNDHLDEQDKTFISQVFMQISYKQSQTMTKYATMKELTEMSPRIPFNRYGVEGIDKILDAIGNDWNLDIWFVYQSTGYSIFIISKHLFMKWGICEEFKIEEEIFDRFFKTVEKVNFI